MAAYEFTDRELDLFVETLLAPIVHGVDILNQKEAR